MPPTVRTTLTPATWSARLSAAPILDRSVKALVPGLVRRWQGIDPDIDQAALDSHFISLHLGGAKRLRRRGEGKNLCCETAGDAHSIVPAGASFHWQTDGPVDFVHIYFAPATLAGVIAETFDRDPARVSLQDALGERDPLLATLARSLLDELSDDGGSCAYLDDLMHLIACRALRLHSNVSASANRAQHALAPFRLRRAIDFIEEHLPEAIGVTEIAQASGVSPFHFSRAFRQATGKPPYAYLLERRIARARAMLASGGSLGEIARLCGFASLGQFSRAFRRETGMTPTLFRERR
jgi:AraC family transcriptional regulator